MFIQTASRGPAFLGLSERTLCFVLSQLWIDAEKHHTTSIPAVINTGGDHFVTLARLCPQVYSDIVSPAASRLAWTRVNTDTFLG
jgi:hypothetical protein